MAGTDSRTTCPIGITWICLKSLNAGFQPGDVVMRVDRDQAKMYDDYTPAQISEVQHYKDNIYYNLK